MSTPTPPPPGWQPSGPYVSPPGRVGPVNPDETVQLRSVPGGPPGWAQGPAVTPVPPPGQHQQNPSSPAAVARVEPVPVESARPWWAFLPTLVWLAAAAFTVGALIALS